MVPLFSEEKNLYAPYNLVRFMGIFCSTLAWMIATKLKAGRITILAGPSIIVYHFIISMLVRSGATSSLGIVYEMQGDDRTL